MRVVCIVMFLHFAFLAKAQTDTSLFNIRQEVATSDYVFYVPKQWKNIPQIDISSKDKKFDFTGVSLPTEFNHVPVTATLTLRKYECQKLSAAQDYIISELTSYPDRVTEPGCNYETDSVKILSGEKATLYSTRFLRRTKIFNYSRYDLIAYSKKRKAAYMFTVLIQYRDPTYAFEADNKLEQYVLNVFESVLLR
jgi:hypothetical protein